MNVLVLANIRPSKPGSYERLVAALSQAMRSRGHALTYGLAGGPDGAVAEMWRGAGVRWGVIEGWTDAEGREHAWRFCAPALRLILKERPDVTVVEFGNELPAAAVRAACGVLCPRTRWVWIQQQRIEVPSTPAAHLSRIRLLGCLFARVVAVYEGGRRSLEMRRVRRDRIRVVGNAVSLPEAGRPRAEVRRSLGAAPDSVVAIAVGSLIARKRVRFLLEALAALSPQAQARTVLWIVGEGSQRRELEAYARERGLGARAVFLGARSDVGDLLRASDLFVHAATAEASSYAIMEAMCAGLPCVVGEAGAAAEQVGDGNTGFVCDLDDVGGFAGKWSTVATDDARRINMGSLAHERWRTEFAVDVAVGKYVALYEELGNPC